MVDIHPDRAVYYPHRDFASAAWVKSALLYWEGIYRCVAEGLPTHDDPEIRELLRAGLIESLSPEPYFERATQIFGARLEQLLGEHDGRLPSSVPALAEFRGVEPERVASGFQGMARELKARGYKRAAGALTTMAAQTRGLFATVLASVIGSDLLAAPVTDDPIFDAADVYFEDAKLTGDPKAVVPVDGFAVAHLLVPVPAVEAVASLSVDRLVEIREKYARERGQFRRKVQAHASAIAQLPTEAAVRDYLNSFASEIQEDLNAAREAMKESKMNECWSLLGISAPVALAATAHLAETAVPIVGPVAGFGSLAFAVHHWYLERRRDGQTPEHYLLTLEAAVTGDHGLADAFQKLMSR